jgi:hypothetical protein
MNVHVISSKVFVTIDKGASFQQGDILSTNFVVGPSLNSCTKSEPISMDANMPHLGVQDQSNFFSHGEAIADET